MFLLSTATTEEDRQRLRNVITQPPAPVAVSRGAHRRSRPRSMRRALTLKDAERMMHDAEEYDSTITRGRRG